MNRLFDKARRLNRAVNPIETRIAGVNALIENLIQQEAETLAADGDTLLASVGQPHSKSTSKTSKSRGTQERLPYREFTVFSGRPARVGRTARDNDILTLRHAKPDDLWLHVRNAPGSHVVVPMGRKEDPHPRLLIDAAHLAVHFSSLKGQSDVEVLYTRRRYVQKRKGASPGTVRLIKEKSITLRVEEDRILKILHGESVYQDSQ
jgi:predicted ribosome quality control (RQC) complex YloA/Tae2 family protein